MERINTLRESTEGVYEVKFRPKCNN